MDCSVALFGSQDKSAVSPTFRSLVGEMYWDCKAIKNQTNKKSKQAKDKISAGIDYYTTTLVKLRYISNPPQACQTRERP